MKEIKEYLRVDLDWSSTGLWILKQPFQKTAGANAAYETFGLSKWLTDRFDAWSKWHNAWEPWHNNKNEPDHELFAAYGLSLAIDLKRFLGSDYHVEFREKEIVNAPWPMTHVFQRLAQVCHGPRQRGAGSGSAPVSLITFALAICCSGRKLLP